MFRRIALVLAVSLSSFAVPELASDAHAQPAAGPGTQVIQSANDRITQLLQQKVTPGSAEEKKVLDDIQKIAKSLIDVDQLGKAAMKDQWAKLTPPQQTEFLKVLRELIDANYVKTLRGNVSYKVNYKGEKTDPNGNVVVSTEVVTQKKGRPLKVAIDYVLAKSGKDLKIFDVITDGVGLVENYRTQFNKLIKDKGFEKLIGNMKQRAADLSAATPAAPAPAPTASKG
jgi:phospholipid transport system substrate-binding protein